MFCHFTCLKLRTNGGLPVVPVLLGAAAAALLFFIAGWRAGNVCPAVQLIDAHAAADSGLISTGSSGSSGGSDASAALRVQPALRTLGITPEVRQQCGMYLPPRLLHAGPAWRASASPWYWCRTAGMTGLSGQDSFPVFPAWPSWLPSSRSPAGPWAAASVEGNAQGAPRALHSHRRRSGVLG